MAQASYVTAPYLVDSSGQPTQMPVIPELKHGFVLRDGAEKPTLESDLSNLHIAGDPENS